MIYTTYFSVVRRLPVTANLISIANRTPPGFPGRSLQLLAPSSEILWKFKSDRNVEEYTRKYTQQLESLDVHEIVKMMGAGAIMVCYEGRDKFCHRHLVADWIRCGGYEVTELII